jgi:tight adherence protein B
VADTKLLFIIAVFGAVFFLAYALVVPTLGDYGQSRRRLKKRLQAAGKNQGSQQAANLLRRKYLSNLSPLERWMESLPGMAGLGQIIEQSGRIVPAYRIVVLSVLLGVGASITAWIFTRQLTFVAVGGGVATAIPFLQIMSLRRKRLVRFEEQLPDALDTMTRALKAGHPFNETLHLVGVEMPDPIAKEFELTFNDLNYGNDPRMALLGLLERVPSVNVMAVVTSVLIQRESGGNLAEILEKISTLVRGRFRFQRRVRTLSAEGRFSGWILSLVPFVLTAALHLTSPDYLPMLLEDPNGQKLVTTAIVLMAIGLFWMRQVIRIRV